MYFLYYLEEHVACIYFFLALLQEAFLKRGEKKKVQNMIKPKVKLAWKVHSSDKMRGRSISSKDGNVMLGELPFVDQNFCPK
jgi:hypothetical protein